MSASRRGRLFIYLGFLVRLLFRLPYRQLEGFTRGLSKYVEGLRAPGLHNP
ncbi:hypothetical protein J7L29_07145 [Candidatus Bathyarchaeota archaeon]|nr:hypothetical protein [Candidatus Bathyarchaeota archaeon]